MVEGRGEAPFLLEGSKQCNLLLPCLGHRLVRGEGRYGQINAQLLPSKSVET